MRVSDNRPVLSTLRSIFSKLHPNLLLTERLRLRPQHRRDLLMAHPNLITHRHQTLRQCSVILRQQSDRDHQVVDVVEHQCPSFAVRFLRLQEMHGLIAPVTARVQVVCSVIAVVEAVTVALRGV